MATDAEGDDYDVNVTLSDGSELPSFFILSDDTLEFLRKPSNADADDYSIKVAVGD